MLCHQGPGNYRQGNLSIVGQNPVYLPQTGAAGGGDVQHKRGENTFKRLSVGVGKLPSHVEVEQQIVAWINDLRSDEISALVTASIIKHKVVELHPMIIRPIHPPHDLDGSVRHRKKQAAWCKRFLARLISSSEIKRDDRCYQEVPSRGRLAHCV